jgi:hypothetical protein
MSRPAERMKDPSEPKGPHGIGSRTGCLRHGPEPATLQAAYSGDMRRPPSANTVRNVVIASIVITLFHFTDNFVNIDTYPKASWQPGWFDAVVVGGWLLFTAIGIAGYRLYRRGEYARAHAFLLFYAYAGLSSLGHFLYGSPDEFTTRAIVSIFADGLAGTAVLVVAVRSMVARSRVAA